MLTDLEKESLALSVKIFPYLMGVRFFTDYLQENIYYKVSYPQQNLHRARNQFTLLQAIEKKYLEITDFLHDFLHNKR